MSDSKLYAYLFITDGTQLPLKTALQTIDELNDVENWQIILPNAAVLISRLSVQQLHQQLKLNFPDKKYLLTLLERGKKAGWLAKKSWEFMNEPTSVLERA